jgi:hypothetical protein
VKLDVICAVINSDHFLACHMDAVRRLIIVYQTAWRHNPEERNITISVMKTSRVVWVGNVACIGEK